eukprot:gnl/TRDRNA2_/TRDRNA2_51455_c0_seq1.p1 gnl/TRDRNA2_/TRDRNA2_51455_c0~~gnl/TRDRNA2_/TRDRNA2_51455_c0_seq1.p1  ORF type:complete len:219 (+),score=71.22 gnl/TRDRNA2_/TRDRNA2_51455_c0_seq1:42-659(+)
MAASPELTENAKKVLDEADEFVCGFCALQILDQDGYVKKTKGSSIEAPLHLVPGADGDDSVTLEALFPANPLFFLQITNEEGNYLFGRWWLGEAKWSRTNQVVTLIPKDTQAIHKQLDDEGTKTFTADSEMPFLRNAPANLIKVSFETKEQRFVTKLVSAKLQIPKAKWHEWKQYRLKLWKSSKSWGAEDKDPKDDEKEKEEKKD